MQNSNLDAKQISSDTIVLSDQHRSFLNKRGITDTVIDAFSISTADVPELSLQEAIVIPVNHVDGTHSFNKYRRNPIEVDVKPKYLYERGSNVALYGADKLIKASDTKSVVITEGELDALVCWSANIPAVSSTGGSLSFQESWVELLARYQVYVCFDNDEAGYKGAIKVLDYLPEAYVVFVPKNIPGMKDISDYVAHGGDLHGLLATGEQFLSIEDIEARKDYLVHQYQPYQFHDMLLAHRRPVLPPDMRPKTPTSQSDDAVVRAKSVDCRSLVEFTTCGHYPTTKCLWHNDSDPSLTYYERNNNCYCFVCGKYADAIDIVMAKDGVDFKQAVARLNSK